MSRILFDNNDIEYLGLKKWLALRAAAELYKERVAEHRLMELFWECTLRCNLNCRHCGSDCVSQARVPDMPAADFFNVLDNSISKKVDPRTLLIIISGGEALVRDDLTDIGHGLKKRGYPWGMVTNGMLLTADKLAELREAGLCSIALSLDGPEPIHNDIRQNPKSYERAVRALDAIVRCPGLTYDVITCATPALLPHLPEFRDFLIEHGCKAWRLGTISPMGRAKNMPDILLDGAQERQVLDFIVQTREQGKIDTSFTCDGFLGRYEGVVRDHFYQCDAGITTGGILIDGSISACTSIRGNHIQGNIYKDDFMDVWENRFQKYRDRSWTKKGICADCEMYAYCRGNGMHLYDDDDQLLHCDYQEMKNAHASAAKSGIVS